MSLVKSTNFDTATELTEPNTFSHLFYENTHLKSHPSNQLLLPATTLTACCYHSMFYGCTALTKAPELPATTLANSCYSHMFGSCVALKIAPELLAPTLELGSYINMFSNCSKLEYVKCLAMNNINKIMILGFLRGVSSTGTFVKASGAFWGTNIPPGWTIVEE